MSRTREDRVSWGPGPPGPAVVAASPTPGTAIGPADLDTPPYVPTRDVVRYPDDPRHAIDGGADGLDVVRTCLAVVTAHASPGAPIALQVRGPAQVDRVTAVVAREGLPLTAERARVVSPERAVLVLRVAAPLADR